MKKMSPATERCIESFAYTLMSQVVGTDCAKQILAHEDGAGITFIEAVIADVMETSAWSDEGYYNDSDVRLSVGRVLKRRLGVTE